MDNEEMRPQSECMWKHIQASMIQIFNIQAMSIYGVKASYRY